ncbi:AzlD domain-containing protein [Phaeovulum sp.]|uniref:AzlD domain-containing protein n=1 Tax=Phaeovulum sp. TaxID=2934796 RepID=UPI0035666FF6
MNGELVALALTVGAANWAFRYLPTRLDLSDTPQGGPFARFLAATGPAAIATLAVASLQPMVASAELAELAPVAAGVLGVTAAYFASRSVALATLAGAGLYGVVFALV